MKKIIHIIGARPNFVKAAPVIHALKKKIKDDKVDLGQYVIHTGQHYDKALNDGILDVVGIPDPDWKLEAGSGSHAEQTSKVMIGVEKIVSAERPDLVVVYGDVNSTIGAALACSKLGVRLAHVESGMRSYDRTMPEEINRVVTDHLSDILFTTCEYAGACLEKEGLKEKVEFVGNTMIDSLKRFLDLGRLPWSPEADYGLITLHRPTNTDDKARLNAIIERLGRISETIWLYFPLHPRTKKALSEIKEELDPRSYPNLIFMEPMGYLEFLSYETNAKFVITDSGGVQEETTFLGVPCLTLRKNTERPITISTGTNSLVTLDNITEYVKLILAGEYHKGGIPDLWDGKAGERIANFLEREIL